MYNRSRSNAYRVIHISTVHPTFDQRIFHRECYSLNQAGYDVHLLVQHDSATDEVDGIMLHSVGKLKKATLGIRLWLRVSRLWRSLIIARRLKGALYHLHDPELIPLGLLLKLLFRKRVVFDCHENNTAYLRQKTHLNRLLRAFFQFVMFGFEWLAAKSFDAIITADQGVADLFEKQYRARRVVIIHNFPRLDLFSPSDGTQYPDRAFDLVYHGTIPRYHLEVAFKVADILRQRGMDVHWMFFGNCPEIKWIQSELQQRGLSDLIQVDDHRIPHELVADRVRQANIGIIPLPDLPKFQHNLPTKLFEYMALGMPIVLSDLPPSRPFVGDGKCAIMVPPDDYTAYAEAIITLLQDDDLRQRMGQAGMRRVQQSYNWHKESQKLLQLYQEIIALDEI